MNVYIFLTNKIGGVSGGVRYVANKIQWLEQHNWIVDVFDTTGQDNEPIQITELKKFKTQRVLEFFYYPSWLSSSRRERVLNSVCLKYDITDNIVIESNTNTTAVWGELIAKRLNAKHIVYLIGEHISINSQSECDFLAFKLEKNEFFSINIQAIPIIFKKYAKIENPENHVWTAIVNSPIGEVKIEALDNLPSADFTIGHLGRRKGYFSDMKANLIRFANKFPDKSINIIYLGIKEENTVGFPNNVHLLFLEPQVVLPKSFFSSCGCIIGVAGCACIAYSQGCKVITYDVNSNRPLGVMGYTTINHTFKSNEAEDMSLYELLVDCLVDHDFDSKINMEMPKQPYGLEYQEECALTNKQHDYFANALRVEGGVSAHDAILKKLLKIGLVIPTSYFRYWNFKRKNR